MCRLNSTQRKYNTKTINIHKNNTKQKYKTNIATETLSNVDKEQEQNINHFIRENHKLVHNVL
jgi:hypothetical protein